MEIRRLDGANPELTSLKGRPRRLSRRSTGTSRRRRGVRGAARRTGRRRRDAVWSRSGCALGCGCRRSRAGKALRVTNTRSSQSSIQRHLTKANTY